MKKAEITAAKILLRGQVAELLTQISAVTKVPERILSKADLMEVQRYKSILEEAKSKCACSYQHGTLNDLVARKNKLDEWLAVIR